MMTPPTDGQGNPPLSSRPEIRPATGTDVAAVQALARAAYALYVPRIGREPAPMHADFATQIATGQVHVATLDNVCVGYIVLYPRGDHVHVENIAVDPRAQGRGVGKALLNFAEDRASDHGLYAIELYTNEKMTENLQLYPRLGYREIDRRSEAGFARVYFRKDLG